VVHPAADRVVERDEVPVRPVQVLDAEFDLVERGSFALLERRIMTLVIVTHGIEYVLVGLIVPRRAGTAAR